MAKKEKKSKVDVGSSGEALTAEEVSKKYTVAELKYILKENGLKVSGKKQDLVERVLPILNEDSSETSSEDVSDNPELTEEKTFKVKKIVFAETEDSSSFDDDLSFKDNEESLISALGIFGINYDDLSIEDKILMEDNANLNIQGFIQDGLSMSDYTMSIVAASDNSGVNLKMNIPEVSYSDFESTIFTFKNLDLSILPSSNPQNLEFSALMGSLEIITETNYVNLKGLDLFFKYFSDENGLRLDIDINSFVYPNFNNTSFNFEDLDFNMAIGLDDQSLDISVNLPKLNLISKDYKVNLSDLNLSIVVPDLQLSNLDLSVSMSDFHYTNFDDVIIDMDNVNVSNEPITNSNSVDVIIRMDAMDATGLNSFDELFPMLNITGVNIKNSTDELESPINLTAIMYLLDISKMSLTSIGSLLSSGFDIGAYTSNIPDQNESSLEVNAVDISSTDASDSESSGFDLAGVFENCNYSCFDAIQLDLTGLLDSADIDLADFGIDVSDYDLSAISLSDVIDVLGNSEFVMTAIGAISKLFSIDFDNLDLSGLIVSFDTDNFDISGLLSSLNLSLDDISSIVDVFTNSDVDLEGVFENCDLSCLGAIVLDLSGLIDSLGIDLADLGIDLSDYDLSAISLAEVIGILGNLEFDMSTLAAVLKLFCLDLDELDLSGLIASFDADNFDLSSLLASLNLSEEDISGIIDMFTNSDVDWDKIFENCDYSSLDTMVLDLTGLIDSAGIDLAELGIDVSDYDLSAISLAEVIGILSNSEFDMSEFDLSALDLGSLDLSGLIASFDTDNFDISPLLASLNISVDDISSIVDVFTNSDVDFDKIFENCDLSCLGAIVLDLSGLIDSLGIDLADLGIDVSDYDLSAISLAEVIGILGNLDIDMSTITALLKLFGLDVDELDLSGLIAMFDADNFDLSSLLDSLNLAGLDISGIVNLFNDSEVDWASVFENCDYSCLGAIVLDLSGLVDSLGIDLADFGIDVSDYDLSAISLAEVIDVLSNSEFVMTAIAAISKLFSIDLESIDWAGLITGFDADNFDISGLLNSLELAGLDISGILGNFSMNTFELTEFLNNLIGMFMEGAVQDYDTELICQSNLFNLESLNKLFDMSFINGDLKVCIDDELLFEGATTDDLTQEIFEITEECLGKHEITIEFTDSQGKSNSYDEKIVVE